jgi:hypothetical protein
MNENALCPSLSQICFRNLKFSLIIINKQKVRI